MSLRLHAGSIPNFRGKLSSFITVPRTRQSGTLFFPLPPPLRTYRKNRFSVSLNICMILQPAAIPILMARTERRP